MLKPYLPYLVVSLMACGEGGPPMPVDDNEVVLADHCNPLSTDSCMQPWPSSFYLKEDSATETGYRVNYAVELAPVSTRDVPVDVTRFNLLDGFSIGSQIIAYFKSGVSPEGLLSISKLEESTKDGQAIAIIAFDTGERVPFYAEMDANAKGDFVPALIIRPQTPLRHNTRYAVVIRDGLKDLEGIALKAPDAFRRLRDQESSKSEMLHAYQDKMESLFSFLATQGIERKSLILAWDFHTSSAKAVTQNLVAMVAKAKTELPADGPDYVVEENIVQEASEKHLLRAVSGKMQVPSFLATDELHSMLQLDDKGLPKYRGNQPFHFQINIPRCAETAAGPLPVLVFGHGLFVGPESELLSWLHKKLSNKWCMVMVSTHWTGLSDEDLITILNHVLPDFSKFPIVTDRLQQAHVNVHAVVQLMKGKFLQDEAMQVNGHAITDGKEIYYIGYSNGGIQGVGFAALTDQIERFVFNVSGGWWSQMMERSSNFEILATLLGNVYEDPLDRLQLIALSQHLWDYTDPIVWAPYVIKSPLDGIAKKRILLQESKYDDQVPNRTTRAIARALGLDGLATMLEPIYGIEEKAGPLDSAYTQWNIGPKLIPPEKNVPAPVPKDEESAHKVLRVWDTCIAQQKAFLTPAGQVTQTCTSLCNEDK